MSLSVDRPLTSEPNKPTLKFETSLELETRLEKQDVKKWTTDTKERQGDRLPKTTLSMDHHQSRSSY